MNGINFFFSILNLLGIHSLLAMEETRLFPHLRSQGTRQIRSFSLALGFSICYEKPEVTFSFPWAVPPNKIDLFGSWLMMAFLLILTIGSLYEWKRGASDLE
uniref:NADH-ubiquinone oxidoreductase chain 3 n=1 Tax=Aegilops tauschii subsp. strangulata TaxID=200361 RepID=A0A453SSK8_AEGTS